MKLGLKIWSTNANYLKPAQELFARGVGRFQTPTLIKDTGRLKADLFSEVDATIAFITKHINRRVIITGVPQHEEVWEYPLPAIREIVINAIVHRDYRCASDTVVKIFDDRIEFYNPGKLPPGISLRNLLDNNYVSNPRNKQIATVFKEAGIIEKYGSGIRRIRDAFAILGSPEPIFEEIGEGFRVTIFPMTPQKTPQKGERSSLSQRILDLLKEDPTLTRDTIAARLGVASNTVKEYLTKLKRSGRLHRKGGRKSGVWEVSDNEEG